jgi:hypothetical protein
MQQHSGVEHEDDPLPPTTSSSGQDSAEGSALPSASARHRLRLQRPHPRLHARHLAARRPHIPLRRTRGHHLAWCPLLQAPLLRQWGQHKYRRSQHRADLLRCPDPMWLPNLEPLEPLDLLCFNSCSDLQPGCNMVYVSLKPIHTEPFVMGV